MNSALEIMSELEKAFNENQAKVMTNAILMSKESVLVDAANKDDLKLLGSDLGLMRSELRQEMSEQKLEIIAKMANIQDSLRQEMGTLKDDLRTEMSTMKDDLRTEIGSMKDDLRTEISTMKDDLHKLIIAQTRWYLVGIAFLVSILTLVLKLMQ